MSRSNLSTRLPTHHRRGKGEDGETLVELLITVVIMGIAFTALLAGIATAIGSTRTHRQQANSDLVLPAAADAVKSNTLNPYKPCNTLTVSGSGTSYTPTPAGTPTPVPLPSGWANSNITITAVKGWSTSTSTWVTCSSSVTDTKLELITVQVVTPGTPSTTETIDVVKRDPS